MKYKIDKIYTDENECILYEYFEDSYSWIEIFKGSLSDCNAYIALKERDDVDLTF